MAKILGLDVGGANLKAADAQGRAVNLPFPLWQHPKRLFTELRTIFKRFAPERIAVTMTGELCDCFATKRAGVAFIVDAVVRAAGSRPVYFWSTAGRFVSADEANAQPLAVAAANWHALATHLGALYPRGEYLLLDIGSTTADIIPILRGVPSTRGFTDPERLRFRELVYTGVIRTPLCALLGLNGAAELFATTEDIYILLGDLFEAAHCSTADGKPATKAHAHARLARMTCDDAEGMSWDAALELAGALRDRQVRAIAEAVASRFPAPIDGVILSGSGAFLIPRVLAHLGWHDVEEISLAEGWGPETSSAACAFAVARLLQ